MLWDYEADIGNGLPPLELRATCARDAAEQVLSQYSTEIVSIRVHNQPWQTWERRNGSIRIVN